MKGSLYVVGPGKYDIDLIFLIIHILLFPSTVNKIISSLSLQEKKKTVQMGITIGKSSLTRYKELYLYGLVQKFDSGTCHVKITQIIQTI